MLFWLLAVMLLGLTARLASAAPAHSASTDDVDARDVDDDCTHDESDAPDEEDGDDDDPIDVEDLILDEEPNAVAPSVIAEEQREAIRRRQGARLGRVDVSLGWRRRTSDADRRNELWLTATWRL